MRLLGNRLLFGLSARVVPRGGGVVGLNDLLQLASQGVDLLLHGLGLNEGKILDHLVDRLDLFVYPLFLGFAEAFTLDLVLKRVDDVVD